MDMSIGLTEFFLCVYIDQNITLYSINMYNYYVNLKNNKKKKVAATHMK